VKRRNKILMRKLTEIIDNRKDEKEEEKLFNSHLNK
jgi:hypothetical protein